MPDPTPAPITDTHTAVAPAWHTLAVLAFMLGISYLGAYVRLPAIAAIHGRVASYLFVLIFEWSTVAFIWWGIRRRGITLSELIGGRWTKPSQVFRDLGLGILFILVFGAVTQVLTSVLHAAQPASVRAMLPQTPLELALWIPVSMTGGICEELIFRGYLQRQFSVLTRSVAGGIVLQGILFGLSHGYQGWKLMFIISVFGACFGCLALWRRSLRPGMFGHVLQDGVGGFLAHFVH